MTRYGIKIVWSMWNDYPGVGFSDSAYYRWKDSLSPGTRMLLYEISPTQAITGEAKVSGSFADGEKIPPQTKEHPHMLPLEILRSKSTVTPIPLKTIREILRDDRFPLQGESWHPLSEYQYNLILEKWVKN